MAVTLNLGTTKVASESDSNKVLTLNAMADEYDAAIAGMVEVTVTTADITLTHAEALNRVFKIIGVLTGNRAVKFPITGGAARAFIVWNATSGAFTLTVKTTHGSSTGIAVTQGQKQLLFHDLVNVYQGAPGVA